MDKKENRASLSVSKETKGQLDSIKHTGQSYNGLIQELVRLWEREHGVEENLQGRSGRRSEKVIERKSKASL